MMSSEEEPRYSHTLTGERAEMRLDVMPGGRTTLAMENREGPLLQYCIDLDRADMRNLIGALTLALATHTEEHTHGNHLRTYRHDHPERRPEHVIA